MSRNGSGTYSLPAGNPVTTGTTISSTTHNNTMSDVASAITESIARDGQTTPTANLPMGGFKHTNVADATARTDYGKVSQIQDGGYMTLSSVSGADTITATIIPSITAYALGQFFTFVSAGANTGAVTLNINSLGAKAVTKEGTTALAAGDIASGAVVNVVYDGTRFQIISGRSVQPLDALLTALAAQTTAANNVQAYSGADTPTLLSTGTSSGNIPLVGTSSATDALAGLVELATSAEVAAGTDTARAITPAGLASSKIVAGTVVASTSGTSIDFTGIPSWAKRITIMLAGVSTNGTSSVVVQLGDSGGFETSGYTGGSIALSPTPSTGVTANSTYFLVVATTAATVIDACLVLSLLDSATNTWMINGNTYRNESTDIGGFVIGSKPLSSTLTQVRLTTAAGTDTFDAGSVNILYE